MDRPALEAEEVGKSSLGEVLGVLLTARIFFQTRCAIKVPKITARVTMMISKKIGRSSSGDRNGRSKCNQTNRI